MRNSCPKVSDQTTIVVDCLYDPRQSIDIGSMLAKVEKITCRIEADLNHANLWRIRINRNRLEDLLKAISRVDNVKAVDD